MNARTRGARASAILLAAGESRRMGGINKLALTIDGVALVRRTLETIVGAGVGEIVVVLGHECERIEALVARPGVRCVRHADYARGQQGSVMFGLASLGIDRGADDGRDVVMVVLADLPLLEPDDLNVLLEAFDARAAGVEAIQPWFEGRRGNPALVSRAVVRGALARGDIAGGLRAYLDSLGSAVARFDALNDHYTFDLDTPEDVERLERRLGRPVVGWRAGNATAPQ